MRAILICAALLLSVSSARAELRLISVADASHNCLHKLSRDGTEVWQCGHEPTGPVAHAAAHRDPPPHEPPPHEPPPHDKPCGERNHHKH